MPVSAGLRFLPVFSVTFDRAGDGICRAFLQAFAAAEPRENVAGLIRELRDVGHAPLTLAWNDFAHREREVPQAFTRQERRSHWIGERGDPTRQGREEHRDDR